MPLTSKKLLNWGSFLGSFIFLNVGRASPNFLWVSQPKWFFVDIYWNYYGKNIGNLRITAFLPFPGSKIWKNIFSKATLKYTMQKFYKKVWVMGSFRSIFLFSIIIKIEQLPTVSCIISNANLLYTLHQRLIIIGI